MPHDQAAVDANDPKVGRGLLDFEVLYIDSVQVAGSHFAPAFSEAKAP